MSDITCINGMPQLQVVLGSEVGEGGGTPLGTQQHVKFPDTLGGEWDWSEECSITETWT